LTTVALKFVYVHLVAFCSKSRGT